MVGRVADAVVLSEEERRFLEGQVRRHKAPRSLSDRRRMILLCAEGLPSKVVAAQRGVHRSTEELEADIAPFIEAHNEHPTPYKWVKSADEILASAKRFCQRNQKTLCDQL